MKIYAAIVERCSNTWLYVGYVPSFSGADFQGATLDDNLHEVIAMILEDGEPRLDAEFVGTRALQAV